MKVTINLLGLEMTTNNCEEHTHQSHQAIIYNERFYVI